MNNYRLEPFSRTKLQEKQTKEFAENLIEKFSKQLENLRTRNENTKNINYKIYHILTRPYTFINAQVNMRLNKGFLSKGVDKSEVTNEHFGQKQAVQIALEFKNNSYKFKPGNRTWIPKPGKKSKRPIDTPTQKDRIVQEAIRGILECIYEPEFKEWESYTNNYSTNFGFRTGLGCWDALYNIKSKSQGCTWVIEGDFHNAYNAIDHSLLLSILKIRIKDKKFLNIIDNLLKAGVMEENKYTETLSGVPQGGIVSPLLFNIYMFELDKWIYHSFIKERIEDKAHSKIKFNSDYTSITRKISSKNRVLKSTIKIQDRKETIKELRSLRKIRNKFPTYDIQSIPKYASYTRYADDWVLCITDTKQNVEKIKKEIEYFTKNILKMSLNEEKTLITKMTQGVNFLGYNFIMNKPEDTQNKKVLQKRSSGEYIRTIKRTTSRNIVVGIDSNRIKERLISERYARLKDGKMFPTHNPILAKLSPFEIVLHYRRVQIGTINYYRNCDKQKILELISYILQYSCAMTIANREKISIKKVFDKYGKKLRIKNPIAESTNYTEFPTITELRSNGKLEYKKHLIVYKDPFKILQFFRTKYKVYTSCCICGSTDNVQLHHTNSLRNIKNNNNKKTISTLEQKLLRKQIPLCFECHKEVTYGKYSNPTSPISFYDEYIAKL